MSLISGCSDRILLKPTSSLRLKLGSTISAFTESRDITRRFRVVKKDGETAVELAGEVEGKQQPTVKDLATTLAGDRHQQLRYLVSLRTEMKFFCLVVDGLLAEVIDRTGIENIEEGSNMESVHEFLTSHPHFRNRGHFSSYPKMTEREVETFIYRLLFLYALFG